MCLSASMLPVIGIASSDTQHIQSVVQRMCSLGVLHVCCCCWYADHQNRVSNIDVILITHTTHVYHSIGLSPRAGRLLNACMDKQGSAVLGSSV